jgi:transcriptional regulator with XRE-family HTH domain
MQKKVTSADQGVAERLRVARERAGVSQTALAKAVGVTFQQIQKYENGRNRISAGRLQHIARILDVPISVLMPDDVGEQNKIEEFLALDGSGELVEAFVAIEDPHMRWAIINLAQAAARPARAVLTALEEGGN